MGEIKVNVTHEAERAVLGAVLLNPSALTAVRDILGNRASAFDDAAHESVYETMLAPYRASIPLLDTFQF